MIEILKSIILKHLGFLIKSSVEVRHLLHIFFSEIHIWEEQNFEEENSIHYFGVPERSHHLTVVSHDIWVVDLRPVDIGKLSACNDKGNDPDALKQPAGEVVEENGDRVPNCQQNQRNIGKNHQEWVDGSDR